ALVAQRDGRARLHGDVAGEELLPVLEVLVDLDLGGAVRLDRVRRRLGDRGRGYGERTYDGKRDGGTSKHARIVDADRPPRIREIPRVRRSMVGPTDGVQPWMPRAARDSDACSRT